MRNSILITCLVLTAITSVKAQTKGFVTGQMSMSSTSSPDSDDKTTTGTFGPAVGYNLSDRIVLGLGLNYTGSTFSNETQSGGQTYKLERKNNLMTIQPFARYMKKVDDDFSLYGQLTVGIGFGKTTDDQLVLVNGNNTVVESKSELNIFSTSVGPGVAYTVAPRWVLTADWGALRYESRSSKADTNGAEKNTTNTFGFALNPSAITFALNWLF